MPRSDRNADTSLVGIPARPHAARLRLQSYPRRGALEARFGDVDANGHLNNLALESIHENTRATLNAEIFLGIHDRARRRIRLVSAMNVAHFLREAHWPATIQTAVGIGRIGRTSFVASTALFLDGACLSVCDTLLVALDDAGPTPIPHAPRQILQTLLLRADADGAPPNE